MVSAPVSAKRNRRPGEVERSARTVHHHFDPGGVADPFRIERRGRRPHVRPGPHFRYDVFVHDLAADTTTLVSGPAGGGLANEASMEPSISGDRAFVAFSSYASNLVDGDTNQHKDVFVRRLG